MEKLKLKDEYSKVEQLPGKPILAPGVINYTITNYYFRGVEYHVCHFLAEDSAWEVRKMTDDEVKSSKIISCTKNWQISVDAPLMTGDIVRVDFDCNRFPEGNSDWGYWGGAGELNIFMDIIFHPTDNNIYSLPLFMCQKVYRYEFYLVDKIGFFQMPKKCKEIEFWFRRCFGYKRGSWDFREKFDSNFGKNYRLLISESENSSE